MPCDQPCHAYPTRAFPAINDCILSNCEPELARPYTAFAGYFVTEAERGTHTKDGAGSRIVAVTKGMK